MPIILVALKTDMRREDPNGTLKPVDGFNLMNKIGAAKYVECSAQTREGLAEVFLEAAKTVLDEGSSNSKRKKKRENRGRCKFL